MLLFYTLSPCFLWSPSLKSVRIQASTWWQVVFRPLWTLGISGIRRRAGHVRTGNNPKPVVLRVGVAWASALSPFHHPSPVPTPAFSAGIHIHVDTCGSSLSMNELHVCTCITAICVFLTSEGGKSSERDLFALCYMIDKCLWTSAPLILGRRFQGCL